MHIVVCQGPYHFVHLLQRIDFIDMSGKRSDANPHFTRTLASHTIENGSIVLIARVESTVVIERHLNTQLVQHLHIAFCHGNQRFVAHSLAHEFLLVLAPFVDFRRFHATQLEARTQIFGAEHIVQVCHRIKLPLFQLVKEFFQSDHSIIFIHIHTNHLHVGRHPIEERFHSLLRKHGDAHFGMLTGKRMHDGHCHSHIAYS